LFYRSLDEINRLWNEDLNPSESVKQTVGASSRMGLGSNHIEELDKVSGIVRWVLTVYLPVRSLSVSFFIEKEPRKQLRMKRKTTF
jgi:hypothetical protein